MVDSQRTLSRSLLEVLSEVVRTPRKSITCRTSIANFSGCATRSTPSDQGEHLQDLQYDYDNMPLPHRILGGKSRIWCVTAILSSTSFWSMQRMSQLFSTMDGNWLSRNLTFAFTFSSIPLTACQYASPHTCDIFMYSVLDKGLPSLTNLVTRKAT